MYWYGGFPVASLNSREKRKTPMPTSVLLDDVRSHREAECLATQP
jgi:hypothetical protein